MRTIHSGIILLGLACLIFGAMWGLAIFPSMKKIPSDYEQTVDFQGSYSVIANQDFLEKALASPSILGLMASPRSKALLSSSEVRQLLASSSLQALLANPSLLQLVASGGAAESIGDPAIRQILANPTVRALLADEVIRRLLADPAALALILDPRAVDFLSSPLGMTEIPVNLHRVRTALRTDGDTLFLNQDFEATVLGSGQPLPRFSTKDLLAVHRETREYVPGGSDARTGLFALPFDVKKDQVYPIWVTEVFQTVPARFEKEDDIDGLKVFAFRVKESNLTLPSEAKISRGLLANLDFTADVDILMHTEPKSGITVALESDVTYKLLAPSLGNPTVFRGTIETTGASVASSTDDAEDVNGRLFWYGPVLTWAPIGFGIALVAAGAIWLGAARMTARTSKIG